MQLNWWLQEGDSALILKTLDTASVDALVTDPPAGISFMGKDWDGHKGGRDKWIAWLRDIFVECRRVMKPGAYGWVWALPRTSHWTATACEDAGFAVRDVLVHVTGQGIPKGLTVLKGVAEHWILVRAPGPLQDLRIDENRIDISAEDKALMEAGRSGASTKNKVFGGGFGLPAWRPNLLGRHPTNFALSHTTECGVGYSCVACSEGEHIDTCPDYAEPCEECGGTRWALRGPVCSPVCPVLALNNQAEAEVSRFFYVAKPSTRERSAGMPEGTRNTHVTVKATTLMQHLISLIAAPGGLVLDPFAGSGTTGIAAVKQGCRFVGIEREAEHVEIARHRIAFAVQSV